jgi:pimeloyl-ACP methyl ester carboxylesterase
VDQQLVGGVAVREWGDPADPGILLWPGLGSNGGYFAGVAKTLPGRAVAVDPPGFGRSPPPESYDYGRLVALANAVVSERGCRACIGHSLGAYLAVGVAGAPPVGLRAVVLIDGGFMSAGQLTELGIPVTAGRAELVAWMRENSPRFPDWQLAISVLAGMVGSEVTPALEAVLREELVEVDGEVRNPTPPERVADLLLAVVGEDVVARARDLALPTLLIACGQPAEHRAMRERAWQNFAEASTLVEVRVAEDWGHNPILQDPDGASRLIGDWLRRHL